ncbi:sensor histidine kinase [Dendrosporobacter sp. 1207_IL3150]|uniref:sensor histidine kinase n=1 Tax=Dendrosporobacter sp. 1207_IL3150 TaxID=3084054 RepID=UPI002FD9BFEC
MKVKKLGWVILLATFVSFLYFSSSVLAHHAVRREVLVLHSYSPDYDWTKTEQQGIDSVFEHFKDQYKVRIEYMDTNHSPKLMQGELLKNLYKQKFANSYFSAVIVTDNAALNFLRLHRDELFPDVPIVFCGVNGFNLNMVKGLSGVTGVAEDNDFRGLFDLILKLHQNTKRLVVYGIEDDPSHIANIALIKKLIPELSIEIEIKEIPYVEAAIADVKNLPKDSIVMAVGSMKTSGGEGVNLQRVNELISEASPVPVYTAWDFGLNHGAVGGLVVSGKDQGRLAAEMALRILQGEKPEDIAIIQSVKNVYMFDYKQLSRFGLNRSKLPANSIIFNSPDLTYRVSREAMWATAFFLIALAAAVLVLTANIQRRKKAEAALTASEEKYSKAFRNCADVVGIARLSDGYYMEVSDAFFETFGYSREEVIDRSSTAVNSQNDHSFGLWLSATERNNLFNKLSKDGFLRNLETHWCTKSGEVRIGLYSAEVISINGEDCIVYVWHDITDSKRAEEALRTANDDLENKVYQRTLELSSLNEELIAINEELQAINDELHSEVDSRRKVEEKLAEANDELKRAFEELKAMQAYLVQSEKMAALGSLVAGVAHEINTPLGVGVTAASHLMQLTERFKEFCQNGNPRRQHLVEYLEDIEEAAAITYKNLERAAKLVHSFKQVSVDQSSEARRAFNVREYLDEILLSMQPQIKRTKLKINIDCERDVEIVGYPGAFAQVITNLVMNTLTHAFEPGDEGSISIRIERQDRQLVCTYSDNGKGMYQNVLAKIFDPFYTTKRGNGGTGLGLYIVYNIVTQKFNGTIKCESEPGRGTRFDIYLPLRKGGPADGKQK